MLKMLAQLVKLTVVTGIAIILLVLSFDSSANATVYNGGGIAHDGQKVADEVSTLDLNPGGFTQQECNPNSTGTLMLSKPPSTSNYITGTTVRYQAGGGLRCDLTVTSMVGPSKYKVST
jgi:hypothetical protein